jgi:O-antigen/teichoic acid export membrane protein
MVCYRRRNSDAVATNLQREERLKTGLISRVASDTAVYGFALAASKLVSFLLLPVYTQALAPADYARLDLLLTFNAAIALTCVAGIDSGMVMILLRDGQEKFQSIVSSSWWTIVIWSCVVLIVAAVAVPLIFPSLIGSMRPLFLLAIAIIPFQVSVQFAAALFKWQRRRAAFMFFSVLPILSTAGVAIWLVLGEGLGIRGALLAMLSVAAFFTVLAIFRTREQIFSRPDIAEAKDVLRAGLSFAAGSVIVTLMPVVVRLELIGGVGLAAVGLYAAADRLSLVLKILGDAFGNAWSPAILAAGGINVDRQQLANVTRLFVAVLVVGAVTAAIWAPLIVRWLLGARYAGVQQVIGFLLVASAIGAWRREGVGVALYLGQRPFWLPVIGALQLGLIALCLPVLGRLLGIAGAAAGMLAIELVMLVLLWAVSQRVFRIPYAIAPALLAGTTSVVSAGTAFCLWELRLPALLDFAIRMAVYVVLLVILIAGRLVTLDELLHISRKLRAAGAKSLNAKAG